MLVCHCNVISQSEMEQLIRGLLDEDPWQLIVPAKVFRAAEARGKCCGCIRNISETITAVVETYHRELDSAERDVAALMQRLAAFGTRQEVKQYARRTRSYRTAKRSPVS